MLYTLKDCRKQHEDHPETFNIPTQAQIDNLKAGDYVKLIFDDKERMWVKILIFYSQTGLHCASFMGKLNSEPVTDVAVTFGQNITFKAKHIAEIITDCESKLFKLTYTKNKIEEKIKAVNPLLTADQLAAKLIENLQEALIPYKFNPNEYNFFLIGYLRPNLGEN